VQEFLKDYSPGWPLNSQEKQLSEKRTYRKFSAKQKAEIVLAGLRGDRSVRDVGQVSGRRRRRWRASESCRARPAPEHARATIRLSQLRGCDCQGRVSSGAPSRR
jgi:hypothetical protein